MRLLLQPWWFRTVCATVLVVVAICIGMVIEGHRFDVPALGVVLIVVASVIVGGVFAVAMGLDRERYLDALSVTTSNTERSEAIAAVWRGPVPDNTRVKEAAGRLASILLSRYISGRSRLFVLYPLLSALWVVLAVSEAMTHHPGRALYNALLAALFVFAMVWSWRSHRRLQNRVDSLFPTQVNSS